MKLKNEFSFGPSSRDPLLLSAIRQLCDVTMLYFKTHLNYLLRVTWEKTTCRRGGRVVKEYHARLYVISEANGLDKERWETAVGQRDAVSKYWEGAAHRNWHCAYWPWNELLQSGYGLRHWVGDWIVLESYLETQSVPRSRHSPSLL